MLREDVLRGSQRSPAQVDPLMVPLRIPAAGTNGKVERFEEFTAMQIIKRAAEIAVQSRVDRATIEGFTKGIDKQVDDYFSRLGNKVPPASAPDDYKKLYDMVARIDPEGAKAGKYQIFIVQDRDVDAKAASNRIIVTTGMLELTKRNPDALLGVIAHEVGHCVTGHSYLPPPSENLGPNPTRQELLDNLAKMHLRATMENEADIFTGNRLRQLGVPTAPLKQFLVDVFGESNKNELAALRDMAQKFMSPREAATLIKMVAPYPDVDARQRRIDPGGKLVPTPENER